MYPFKEKKVGILDKPYSISHIFKIKIKEDHAYPTSL